jgi:hypothetical protein
VSVAVRDSPHIDARPTYASRRQMGSAQAWTGQLIQAGGWTAASHEGSRPTAFLVKRRFKSHVCRRLIRVERTNASVANEGILEAALVLHVFPFQVFAEARQLRGTGGTRCARLTG